MSGKIFEKKWTARIVQLRFAVFRRSSPTAFTLTDGTGLIAMMLAPWVFTLQWASPHHNLSVGEAGVPINW